MLRKVIFSVIGFIIGVMASISIQACADNEDEIFKANSSSNSDSSSSNSSCKCSPWNNDGIESYITYDEQGNISSEIRYTYNNKGWIEKAIQIGYTTISGKRYKSSEYIATYSYSSSGNTQYQTILYNFYNDSGQKISTNQTTTERKLCQ